MELYKILITGGSGFIGSALIPELIRQGHDVYSFERYKPTRLLSKSVPTLFGNINFYESVLLAMDKVKPDVVIHLAAIATRGSYNYDNWGEMLKTHLIGTANVAEASRRTAPRLKCFLFASSAEIYGNQERFPITEEAMPQARGPYTVGKISAELYLQYLYETNNFPTVILRAFNTYGSILHGDVVNSIVSQMLKGGPVRLGNPDAIRDMLWIGDHINAYMTCLEKKGKAIGEIFNICTGRGLSVSEMVNIAREIIGYRGKIKWNTQPKRINEIRSLIGSSKKAEQKLGWNAKVTFEEGVSRIVKAWQGRY